MRGLQEIIVVEQNRDPHTVERRIVGCPVEFAIQAIMPAFTYSTAVVGAGMRYQRIAILLAFVRRLSDMYRDVCVGGR